MSRSKMGRKRPRERPPQGQANGTWTMAKYSAVLPRYPLRLSQQVFEVLHPEAVKPVTQHYPCCGLILKPAEHELLHGEAS